MAEANAHVKSKKPEVSSFEKVTLPRVETPAAFRDIAEKGITQAKDHYEKIKSAADEATSYLESTYVTATRGVTDYGLKLIEAARANTNATFDLTSDLLGTRSLSEAIEVSTAHARKQFDILQTQAKELSTLAQKVATETAEPIKEGISKIVRKVA
jgi:phasin